MDSRLEKLRQTLRMEWGELCEQLEIGRPMMHYLRSGARNASPKLLRRIEEHERSVGIAPPAPVPIPEEEKSEETTLQVMREMGDAVNALRADMAEIKRALNLINNLARLQISNSLQSKHLHKNGKILPFLCNPLPRKYFEISLFILKHRLFASPIQSPGN